MGRAHPRHERHPRIGVARELLERIGQRPVWSRWHRLHGFEEPTWLLREDEHGGTKARKYASLIPSLAGVPAVRLLGSPHSTNVLQLSLRLRQAGIRPVYVEEGRPGPLRGNGLWNRLVLGEDYRMAPEDLATIAEGASQLESLPGALGLASAVARALKGERIHRVVIEAGTGFTAAALAIGLGFLYAKRRPPRLIVVWLGSRDPSPWPQLLAHWTREATRWLGAVEPLQARVILPSTARSFGSVNAGVLDEVARTAREEGVLLDPLYGAKLFLEARRRRWRGGTLLIHSGGSPSGFEDALARRLLPSKDLALQQRGEIRQQPAVSETKGDR